MTFEVRARLSGAGPYPYARLSAPPASLAPLHASAARAPHQSPPAPREPRGTHHRLSTFARCIMVSRLHDPDFIPSDRFHVLESEEDRPTRGEPVPGVELPNAIYLTVLAAFL